MVWIRKKINGNDKAWIMGGGKKRRVKKENGNEQGEGENVGGRIKF